MLVGDLVLCCRACFEFAFGFDLTTELVVLKLEGWCNMVFDLWVFG